MIITQWFKHNKNKEGEIVLDFNHISNGFNPAQSHPTPNTEEQNGWKRSTWTAVEANLIDGKVTKV